MADLGLGTCACSCLQKFCLRTSASSPAVHALSCPAGEAACHTYL